MTGLAFLPIDYLFTGSGSQPITFAFPYSVQLPLVALQESLARVLESFPILNGKIHKLSEQEYEYRIDGHGLVIEQNNVDTVLFPAKLHRFIAPLQSVDDEPVCRIVLNTTPAGSVLAVSMSHALVDGFSYFHFLSSWARQCRGDKFLAPSHERDSWVSRWPAVANNISAETMLNACGLFYEGEKRATALDPLRESRLFLADTALRAMMQEARQGHEKAISENDVLTAHLWKSQLPVWKHLDKNSVSYLTCPFDFRRVYPGFPKNYFGCALVFATATLSLAKLSTCSLGEVALVVHEAVRRMQEEYITESMQTLHSFRLQHGVQGFEHVHLRHPQRGLIVTNLTRLPVRDLDFGYGAPTGFSTRMEFHNSAAILPAENGVEILLAQS
jgi:hypothetical protein